MERSGVQETTGMCRMVGGWPRERERGQKKQKSEGIANHVGIKLKEIPLHVLSASHLSARLSLFWSRPLKRSLTAFLRK